MKILSSSFFPRKGRGDFGYTSSYKVGIERKSFTSSWQSWNSTTAGSWCILGCREGQFEALLLMRVPYLRRHSVRWTSCPFCTTNMNGWCVYLWWESSESETSTQKTKRIAYLPFHFEMCVTKLTSSSQLENNVCHPNYSHKKTPKKQNASGV